MEEDKNKDKSKWNEVQENLSKDWKQIVIIIVATLVSILFIFIKASSLTTVFILAIYVISFLLMQLLNSNVISENDKISFNVKIAAILLAIIFSFIFYKKKFDVISSLIGISLLFDVINQSVKIYYFHKNMVAVNELIIYTDDKTENNTPIDQDDVLEIISKIRLNYDYLHTKLDVKAIDRETANRVREIVVSREKIKKIDQYYLYLKEQSEVNLKNIKELNSKLDDKIADLDIIVNNLSKDHNRGFWSRLFNK